MVKRIVKAIAFWKAPKRTYAVLHPVKAAGLAGTLLAAKLVFDRVRR